MGCSTWRCTWATNCNAAGATGALRPVSGDVDIVVVAAAVSMLK